MVPSAENKRTTHHRIDPPEMGLPIPPRVPWGGVRPDHPWVPKKSEQKGYCNWRVGSAGDGIN